MAQNSANSGLNSFSESMNEVETLSTITCSRCGYSATEAMPENWCQFFYECPNCSSVLRPKPGDCCVFCSYGNVKCPPEQKKKIAEGNKI